MTEIFHEDIELAEVVRRSDLIVVAERKGPIGEGRDTADAVLVKQIVLGYLNEKPGDVLAVHPANKDFFKKAQAQFMKEHGTKGVPSLMFPKYPSTVARKSFPFVIT